MTKIANVELVVCSVEVQAKHPELFHYTKPQAFESIVKSNTFWASHYRDMADQTEVLLMRDRLPPAVAPRFDALIASLNLNRKRRRLWDASGKGIGTARDFVNSLYGATFDNKAGITALDAFMTSFSTHADDSPFDREHGVWSQWRDYAGSGGFCIVLDTVALCRVLGEEKDSRYWVHLKLDPVRYGDAPIEQLFPELVEVSADTLRQFLDGIKYPEMAVQEFMIGATLLKDAGFRSEREVRIVGIPGTRWMSDRAAKEYPGIFTVQPLPEIGTRPETTKRYVSMLEGREVKLPINRVIVGPGAGQEERVALARSLLGNVPVVRSQCPSS